MSLDRLVVGDQQLEDYQTRATGERVRDSLNTAIAQTQQEYNASLDAHAQAVLGSLDAAQQQLTQSPMADLTAQYEAQGEQAPGTSELMRGVLDQYRGPTTGPALASPPFQTPLAPEQQYLQQAPPTAFGPPPPEKPESSLFPPALAPEQQYLQQAPESAFPEAGSTFPVAAVQQAQANQQGAEEQTQQRRLSLGQELSPELARLGVTPEEFAKAQKESEALAMGMEAAGPGVEEGVKALTKSRYEQMLDDMAFRWKVGQESLDRLLGAYRDFSPETKALAQEGRVPRQLLSPLARMGHLPPPDTPYEDITASMQKIPFEKANQQLEFLNSSYEAALGHLMEQDPSIANWTSRLGPEYWVPYTKPNGQFGIYVPDTLATGVDGSRELIEVKAAQALVPGSKVQPGRAQEIWAKMDAARRQAEAEGIGYRVFTEDQIGRDALRGTDPALIPQLAKLDPHLQVQLRAALHKVPSVEDQQAAQLAAEFNRRTNLPRVVPAAKYGIASGSGEVPSMVTPEVWQAQLDALNASLAKAREGFENGVASPETIAKSEAAYRAAIDANLRMQGRDALIGRPETYANAHITTSPTLPSVWRSTARSLLGPSAPGEVPAALVGAVGGGVLGAQDITDEDTPLQKAGKIGAGAVLGAGVGYAGAQGLEQLRGLTPKVSRVVPEEVARGLPGEVMAGQPQGIIAGGAGRGMAALPAPPTPPTPPTPDELRAIFSDRPLPSSGTAKLSDRVAAIFANSLLSNPSSLAVIAGHGLGMSLFRPIVEASHGEFQTALTELRGMTGAIGEAWSKGAQAFLQGRGSSAENFASVTPETFPGMSGVLLTPSLRWAAGVHEFTKTLNAAGHFAVGLQQLSKQVGRSPEEIMAGGTPAFLVDEARQAAELAARGTVDPLTKVLLRVRNNPQTPTPLRMGLTAVFPFVRIPMYLAKTGVKVAAAPVTYGVAAAKHAAAGELGAAGAEASTAALTAYFHYWVGTHVLGGDITGDNPTQPGAPRNSVKIGSQWVATQKLAGPLALPMTAIANAVETAQKDRQQPDAKVVQDVVNATAKTLLDASAFRNAAQLIGSVESGTLTQELTSAGMGTAMGLLPYSGAFNAIATAEQPGQKAPENVWQSVEQHLPLLREQVPNYVPRYAGSSTSLQDQQIAQAISRVNAAMRANMSPDPNDYSIYRQYSGGETRAYQEQKFTRQRQREEQARHPSQIPSFLQQLLGGA